MDHGTVRRPTLRVREPRRPNVRHEHTHAAPTAPVEAQTLAQTRLRRDGFPNGFQRAPSSVVKEMGSEARDGRFESERDF